MMMITFNISMYIYKIYFSKVLQLLLLSFITKYTLIHFYKIPILLYNCVYTSFCCGFNSQYNIKIDTSCKLLLLHFFSFLLSSNTHTHFWYRKKREYFFLLQVTFMLLCRIFLLWKNLFLYFIKHQQKKKSIIEFKNLRSLHDYVSLDMY